MSQHHRASEAVVYSSIGIAIAAAIITACGNMAPPKPERGSIAQGLGTTGAVLTQHNDNARTGLNPSETTLGLQTVGQNSIGKLYTVALSGRTFAQPLFAPQVQRSDGAHDIVVVATEGNNVYGIDGQSGAVLWQQFFGTPIPTDAAYPSVANGCRNIPDGIGITGTPVIDPATGKLYFIAATMTAGPVYHQTLYALDVATGSTLASREISAANGARYPGSGIGAVGGFINFDPLRANQRPGLLFLNGKVFAGWASHCDDAMDYYAGTGHQIFYGWMMSFDASTLALVNVFNAAPNPGANTGAPYGGAIWQGGMGLASDGTLVFANTGNATYNATSGSWGDTVLAFTQSLALGPTATSTFTPYNELWLDTNDYDLSAGGVVVLPAGISTAHPNLLVSVGKEGSIYILDRNNLGGKQPTSGNATCPTTTPGGCAVQVLDEKVGSPQYLYPAPNTGAYFGGPAYYDNKLYFAGNGDTLKQFTLGGSSVISATPAYQTTTTFNYPGSTPSISSNGTSDGIVWALERTQPGPFLFPDPTYLHAYDAQTLAELYNSHTNADDPDGASQFITPTIANGRVYIGTSTSLAIYGLTIKPAPLAQSVIGGNGANYTISTAAIQGLGDTVSFTASGGPAGVTASFSPTSVARGGSTTLTLSTTTAVAAGTYSIAVTATSTSTGRIDSTKVKLTVTPPTPPTAVFTYYCAGRTCYFDGSTSFAYQGRTVTGFAWNYGDGTTDTGATPAAHHFANNTTYTVTLTVTDSGGFSGSTAQAVSVIDTPPHAGFFVTCIDLTCYTDAETSSDDVGIVNYRWTWGDGSVDSSGGSAFSQTSHLYPHYGPFTIMLTVTDVENQTDSTTLSVRLTQPPTPRFSMSCTGRTCTFNATASSATAGNTITAYHWDFGDETTADPTGSPLPTSVNHVFAADGTYGVFLLVTDSSGASGGVTHQLTVADAPPHAQFHAVCQNLTCFIDAEGSVDDIGITDYQWTWGDGTVTHGVDNHQQTTHTYASYGTYTIELQVSDLDAQTDKVTQTVTLSPAPTAIFTSTCNGFTCTFDASQSSAVSPATISQYHFDFDDELTADFQPPTTQVTHTYAFAAKFSVHLRVTDSLGRFADVTNPPITVSAPPPSLTASWTATCNGLTCTFTATANGPNAIQSYHWDFDDEQSADFQPPTNTATHTYAFGGKYRPHLRVTDVLGNFVDVTNDLTVTQPPPALTATFNVTCTQRTCNFDASGSQAPAGFSITQYHWNWDDETTTDTFPPTSTTQHTYGWAQTFKVNLTVTDNGGHSAVASQNVVVH